jgi:hypothetical protein
MSMARIVPNYSAFRKRNDSNLVSPGQWFDHLACVYVPRARIKHLTKPMAISATHPTRYGVRPLRVRSRVQS